MEDYADKLKDVLEHSWEINHSCWDNAYNPCEDTDFGKDTEAIFWEDTGNYRGNVQTVSESLCVLSDSLTVPRLIFVHSRIASSAPRMLLRVSGHSLALGCKQNHSQGCYGSCGC